MAVIAGYCKYMKYKKLQSDIEVPIPSADPNVYIKDEKERQLIARISNLKRKQILMMAANELQITALFELCAAAIAAHFKNKSVA